MARKYKVEADEQFLGHYYGTSPQAAVEKAIDANFAYRPEILGMPDCEFVAQRGTIEAPVSIAWSDMREAAERWEVPLE